MPPRKNANAPTALDNEVEPVADPVAEPTGATDDQGVERPLSGGSYERVDGKLVRREG